MKTQCRILARQQSSAMSYRLCRSCHKLPIPIQLRFVKQILRAIKKFPRVRTTVPTKNRFMKGSPNVELVRDAAFDSKFWFLDC